MSVVVVMIVVMIVVVVVVVGTIMIVIMLMIAFFTVMVVVMIMFIVVIIFFFKMERELGGHVDVTKGQIMGFGDFDAIVVLGFEDRWLFVSPADFPFDRTEIGFNRIAHSLADRALDSLPTDSKRLRFAEQDCLELPDVFKLGNHTERNCRAILLHLNRGRKNIECPGGK